jgi:hypothetical protein
MTKGSSDSSCIKHNTFSRPSELGRLHCGLVGVEMPEDSEAAIVSSTNSILMASGQAIQRTYMIRPLTLETQRPIKDRIRSRGDGHIGGQIGGIVRFLKDLVVRREGFCRDVLFQRRVSVQRGLDMFCGIESRQFSQRLDARRFGAA